MTLRAQPRPLTAMRSISLAAVLAALTMLVPFMGDANGPEAQSATPGAALRTTTIQASGAQTGNGANTVVGASTQIPLACVNMPGFAVVSITAGSGTVTTFKVWLQGSADGTNWATIACALTTSSLGTSSGNANLLENETAVQTSGAGSGHCTIPVPNVRAAWIVNGTTPSETFSVSFSCVS